MRGTSHQQITPKDAQGGHTNDSVPVSEDSASFTLADLIHSVQTMRLPGQADLRERFRVELLGGTACAEIAWDGDHVSVRLMNVGTDSESALPPVASADEISKALADYIMRKGGDPRKVTRDVSISIDWPTIEHQK